MGIVALIDAHRNGEIIPTDDTARDETEAAAQEYQAAGVMAEDDDAFGSGTAWGGAVKEEGCGMFLVCG